MPSSLVRVAGTLLLCTIQIACTRGALAQRRDEIQIAIPQDAKTLNPILSSNSVDGFIQRFMFEPLISADARGNPVPMLAVAVPSRENGGISRDGMTVTYRLRDNARWTDGAPVTARDVAFSWSAIMNPQNNAVSRHGYDDVARIDTPGDRIVTVHLKRPFAPFVDTFFAESDQPYSIVPAHVLERYPNINQVAFDERPDVSDGPFRLQTWARGDRIVLTANDGFFMGKPHLRRIVLRVVPDENTAVNLLRTHAVDYMFQASIAMYPQLRTIPGVRVVWVSANGYEGMGLNLQHKPLNDPRVRLAIAYAIDKGEMVRALTFGQAHAASGDLPDWIWAFDPALKPYPHDPDKARALLRAAGVKLPLSLILVTDTANATHKREAVLLQAMLAEVGIDLELKTYPGDLLYAPAGAGGIINGGHFDIALWPYYAGIDPDNSSQFECANAPPHGYNMMRYCNRGMDRLQERALSTYDRAARIAAYRGIEALVARDNPIVAFWWQRQPEALVVDLKGFAPNPVMQSWNAWQWRL